jgi:hypothetical protein
LKSERDDIKVAETALRRSCLNSATGIEFMIKLTDIRKEKRVDNTLVVSLPDDVRRPKEIGVAEYFPLYQTWIKWSISSKKVLHNRG